ncbi:phosphodiester glycosidase family protein [Tengunoibacter tsumagoiensis]|uniref:Phosphodiester glycosidase domain-containing protein n=1 Tax=Tengunoibacter tsumagoiensis TaxID=2014871 RepID=A0A402A3J9_9CHLR|nr:phosphodiester glycosidase family protein [Tengunoibacter tsumagoiensis]GCE13738.1 hypothetical protein KTT_35970 [Tengunoibacter tsumagoiensis]
MPAKLDLKPVFVLCLLVSFLLASCDLLPSLDSNSATATSQATVGDQSGNGIPLNTWIKAKTGVEIRQEHWKSPGNNEDIVTIARFDLKQVHLSVGYQPDKPLSTSDWMKQTGATAIINGGYFDEKQTATALLIADGQTYVGSSYSSTGDGGLLAVDQAGNVILRALKGQGYDPDTEQLQQATEGAPMFITNGQRFQFNANAASQRRSVIAIDKQGRLLLIVSPAMAFSLDEMADLLLNSDLSIQTALNLDGGSSTSLYVNSGNHKVTIDPYTPLPIVIIIK